jgi:hypothetical protein
MVDNYSWTFTTAAAPIKQSTSPSNDDTDVPLNASVSATFDVPIQLLTASGISISPNPGNVMATVDGSVLNIAHNNFEYEQTYTVSISNTAILGVLSNISWTFTTISAPITLESTSPTDTDTEVPINAAVYAIFNVPITLLNPSGISISPDPGNVIATTDGRSLDISHNNFDHLTTYTVTIPANSLKGLVETISWTFTTDIGTGSEIVNRLEAKLFPNPVHAGSEFTVHIGENGNSRQTVEIYNASGMLMQKIETSDKQIRLTAPNEQGVYLLRIASGNKIGSFRLTIQ